MIHIPDFLGLLAIWYITTVKEAYFTVSSRSLNPHDWLALCLLEWSSAAGETYAA